MTDSQDTSIHLSIRMAVAEEQRKWIEACEHPNPASLSTLQGTYVAMAIRQASGS